MIEKMQFVSISGPRQDIDRVVRQYLSKYEIQLENAMTELGSTTGIKPFVEENPYQEALEEGRALMKAYRSSLADYSPQPMDTARAAELIGQIENQLKSLLEQRARLAEQLKLVRDSEDKIKPFMGFNYEIEKVLKFKNIKFRFGKMPKEYFEKFSAYVDETIDAITMKCVEDEHYVWLVYFVPERLDDKVDAIFSSMHFEKFFVPDDYQGTPDAVVARIDRHIEQLEGEIQKLDREVLQVIREQASSLLGACEELERYHRAFSVRKLAACTKHDEHTFYILCGWIGERDGRRLRRELEGDAMVYCLVEDDHSRLQSKPPTKLKNPRIFKPFELYIRMYGLPAYGELDPTLLVALSYSILFGFMFGDVGQGLCLALGGFLLYFTRKLTLAGIIGFCGLSSTFFGFMFGSIFGFEHIIEARWLRPLEAMTRLPFIGTLNTVFVISVGIGMCIILLTMLLHLVNSFRNGSLREFLFSTNGLAGLVFYAAFALCLVLYMSGRALPAGTVLLAVFVLPLLLIFFQEPLTALVERKRATLHEGVGMFVIQGFFELFEVLLSYFSNTLSFVRVGAFAVSHAAMMEVVLMLAGAERGELNWLVIILGNLAVCGLEGLIVGIQVLRLEYYELFSRFYHGGGREFVPYGSQHSR